MNNVLSDIRWQEQGADSERLLARLEEAVVTPMKGDWKLRCAALHCRIRSLC